MRNFSIISAFISLLSIPVIADPGPLSLSSQQVRKEAAAIDRILEKAHRQEKAEVPRNLDEAKLSRRLYLAIAGRIPSYDEASSYLGNRDGRKRVMLVDSLLLSPAYESQMFNWWADLLRLKSRMRGGAQIGAGQLYNHWVKEQVRENKPFDQVAYSLVTAEGYPWEDGASGYYLRDAGMELDNMSNTTQLFLGTQMVCAQCHNHPFDKWTQQEYYKMAAFTYGISTRKGRDLQTRIRDHFVNASKGLSPKQRKKKVQSKDAAALRKALQEMMRPLQYGSQHTSRKLTLPAGRNGR